jgi:hypothetical protein
VKCEKDSKAGGGKAETKYCSLGSWTDNYNPSVYCAW